MTHTALRRWLWIHKWTSLVCTVFLLVVCLTGLPLIFNDEIEDLFADELPLSNVGASTPNASFDELAKVALSLYPSQAIIWMGVDDDEPKVKIVIAPSLAAFNADSRVAHILILDERTSAVLRQTKSGSKEGPSLLNLILRLHKDLFMGLPGEMFMACMALLFVTAVISGVIVYGPFMRKTEFGTVRNNTARLRYLDLHNMIGIIVFAWLMVVGVTGFINELVTPLFAFWQDTAVNAMLEPYKGYEVPSQSELTSPQAAIDTALAARPGMRVHTIIFPGVGFGTPYHYLIWTKGNQPLTARLFDPVLVNASTGNLDGVLRMPWYLRALQISVPLHYGDYGGLPLKTIWALFDVLMIAVLLTGIYLWAMRWRVSKSNFPSAILDAETGGPSKLRAAK